MGDFDDLVSGSGGSTAGVPVLLLAAGSGRAEALDALVIAFGDDDQRERSLLAVGPDLIGTVHRDTVLDLITTGTKGFGDGDGLSLPGVPTTGGLIGLTCPVPDCPAPVVLVVTYDEDAPPRCPHHPGAVLARIR